MSRRLQSYFLNRGFTGREALEFGEQFSTEAMNQCQYLKKMIWDRQMLILNAKQYKWTPEQSINAIKRSYRRKGLLVKGDSINDEKVIWKLLRWYKDHQVEQTGQIYETPRKKQPAKKYFVPRTSADKQKQMNISRLQDRIRNIDKELKTTKSMSRYDSLIAEKEKWNKRLNELK